MRLATMALIAVLFVVTLAGCGGGGVPTLTLGSDPVTSPPVGTAAVSPSVAKFGPVANYLPPSGTIINYSISGMLGMSTEFSTMRVQFISYDNTAGKMVLDLRKSGGSNGASHDRFTLWVKVIDGQSYCYKRTKAFYDEARSPETSYFKPGALLGLFSNSPAQLNCTFTETGHGTGGTKSVTEQYRGTANVVAGATTYSNCVITEFSKMFIGDIAKMQWYWAPHKGPIVFSLNPAISIKGVTLRLPKWCSLGRLSATSITTAN